MKRAFVLLAFLATPLLAAPEKPLATGDLVLVIERATGSKMCLSVEIVAQAQLDGGDVGLRKSHL